MDSNNHQLKIIRGKGNKIIQIEKQYSSYCHGIYIVLAVVSKVEII